VRHHHSNFKKVHTGKVLKDLFWSCARASTPKYFDRAMEELKKQKPSACTWVMEAEQAPNHWSRAFFSELLPCDSLTNNNCEVWNSLLCEARNKPIISMFECIRNLLMERIRKNRDKMMKCPTLLCLRIVEKIEKNEKLSTNWICKWSGGPEYQVSGPNVSYVVDLVKKTCACRVWQISGIPCVHATSAILFHADKVEIMFMPAIR